MKTYIAKSGRDRLDLAEALKATMHGMGLKVNTDLHFSGMGKSKHYQIRVLGSGNRDTGLDLTCRLPLTNTGRMQQKKEVWVKLLYITDNGQWQRPRQIGLQRSVDPAKEPQTIDAIVMDVADSIRAQWDQAFKVRRCRHCGAPHFKSKAGKEVCSDICWELPALRHDTGRLARLGIPPSPYGTGLEDFIRPTTMRSVSECKAEYKTLMRKAIGTGMTPAEFNTKVNLFREGNSPADYCRAARLAEADIVPPDSGDLDAALDGFFVD
jgi:hypothetical protein